MYKRCLSLRPFLRWNSSIYKCGGRTSNCMTSNAQLGLSVINSRSIGSIAPNPLPPLIFMSELVAEGLRVNIGDENSELAELPASQESLPYRTMEDSFCHAIIPIGQDLTTREEYSTHIGGVRIGKLLKDMDHFACCVLYKYILNPSQSEGLMSAHATVTARVDHIYVKEPPKANVDVRIVGHVTWVGTSSAEVGVRLEQELRPGEWVSNCEAKFSMVARDSATGSKKAFINPLRMKSDRALALFKMGEENQAIRAKSELETLFKEPPRVEETKMVHDLFLGTVDHKARSFKVRQKPDNSEWMSDTKLKSVMLCEPEHRNPHNKVFGGLIMEKCLDLAHIVCWTFTGALESPVCTHIDDLVFLKVVEIGDLLYFHSQVVFTQGCYVQTRVSAEVFNPSNRQKKLANVCQVTWQLPFTVPQVIPKEYFQTMIYLHGRRHYLIAMERQGRYEEIMSATPEWVARSQKKQVEDLVSVEEELEKEIFNPSGHLKEDLTGCYGPKYLSVNSQFYDKLSLTGKITTELRTREEDLLTSRN